MKVHFFRFEINNSTDTPDSLLSRIDKLRLIDREQAIPPGTMFLEDLTADSLFYSMDFTKRRTIQGPGQSVQGRRTTDFALPEGGGFGEQTALVWSRKSDYVAVQYNHSGPRVGAIASYFSRFMEPSRGKPKVEFHPVLDDTVMSRLRNSTVRTKFDVTVDRRSLSEALIEDDLALSSIVNLGDATNAGHLSFQLSLGGDVRNGPLKGILALAGRIMSASPRGLKVGIKDTLDSKMEVLDLLNHREVEEIPDTSLPLTDGLRWDFSSRANAIKSTFIPWLRGRSQ